MTQKGEMMDELISRQAAISIVEFECGEWKGLAQTIVNGIKNLPSAQPETNCSEIPNDSDTISRQAAIDAVFSLCEDCDSGYCGSCRVNYPGEKDVIKVIRNLPPAESEPAIPLSWIEEQIRWLRSLDNAFSALTAGLISAMVNKWKDEQNERSN